MRGKLAAFFRERAAIGEHEPAMIQGGASFAYVFGSVLVFLLLLEAATGAALAAFYSPSTTDAWGSVAYIQDQASLGWLVRGLHFHGGGAIVVVAGLHLVQTAVSGAYKRPRELVWWLGVLLLVLTLAWAVTGYVLRWDQAGYWANRVELGIAAGTPLVGGKIRDLALGGNEYGNLTLTRFYALHVVLLPALVTILTVAHVALARKHGTTPLRDRPAAPRWPDQSLRDAFAMALTLAILLAYVVNQHGADLAAPADPSQAYDARPLWYFRWLFELRELSGSAEKIVAMVVPAIVGGFLVALPLLDKKPERAARQRTLALGALAGMFALIAALTVMSLVRDSGDAELAKRSEAAQKLADRARMLARANGVPVTGAQDVFSTAPMWKARTIFAQKCSGCHDDKRPKDPKGMAEFKDVKGPYIAPGHGNRAWLKAFLMNPNAPEFWALTKLSKASVKAQANEDAGGNTDKPADKKPDPKKPDPKKPADKKDDKKADDKADDKKSDDLAMPSCCVRKAGPAPVKLEELDDLVELLYSLSGAADADKAKVARGMTVFESGGCDNCHTMNEGGAGAAGPGLGGLGSRDYYTSFISNPKSPIHMTADLSEMPQFNKELSLVDRDAVAAYLLWLRTATKADLDALGPL